MTFLRAGLCTLVFFMVGAEFSKVTPMEKVITLLKGLSTKVEAEGKKEAAQYDKYACFCKEQADEKLYSIEKSEAKLDNLKAQIKELDSAISELNSEISGLSKKISGLEGDIKTITEKRNKDHDEYKVKAKDMNEAIEACGAAIEALKDSKSAMKGAKVDLAQVNKATSRLLGVDASLLSAAPGVVALLSALKGEGAPAFEYQSNDILATLEGLQASFKKMKKDLDVEEFDINSAFESKKLGLSNERTFADKERTEKEAIVEAKTEEVESAKTDRDAEKADKDADQTFLDDLTKECEEKALQFDQRSKTRSDELTVLAEATAELEKGAVPNFSANKKLVGLQKKPAVVHKAAIKPVSFVQINSVKYDDAHKDVVIKKVLELLHKAAGRTGSSALANLGLRAKMLEDHFVKVRGLIKDLIAKLKADAKAEASQKSVCDKGMKKAVADRDSANAKIEVAEAKITSLTAKKEELTADISQLQKDIAELQKGILEATELRADDKADNSKTVGMSEEAITSVKLALSMLQDFYNKALFAQTGKYTPPKSDRDGNTVGDLAPEVFDSKYSGSQSESKGIVGILEVILSDFERTKKTTEDEEKMSKEAFEQLEKESKEDIKKKEASVKTKDKEKTDAESDIIDQQQALMDAKELLASSQESLEDLEAMCVKGEETWEERKKKREEEIAALKDALEIFEDWQK